MLEARTMIYLVLRDLEKHESMVRDIRCIVDNNLNESVDSSTVAKIRAIVQRLPALT
jgi:hypothetical protein